MDDHEKNKRKARLLAAIQRTNIDELFRQQQLVPQQPPKPVHSMREIYDLAPRYIEYLTEIIHIETILGKILEEGSFEMTKYTKESVAREFETRGFKCINRPVYIIDKNSARRALFDYVANECSIESLQHIMNQEWCSIAEINNWLKEANDNDQIDIHRIEIVLSSKVVKHNAKMRTEHQFNDLLYSLARSKTERSCTIVDIFKRYNQIYDIISPQFGLGHMVHWCTHCAKKLLPTFMYSDGSIVRIDDLETIQVHCSVNGTFTTDLKKLVNNIYNFMTEEILSCQLIRDLLRDLLDLSIINSQKDDFLYIGMVCKMIPSVTSRILELDKAPNVESILKYLSNGHPYINVKEDPNCMHAFGQKIIYILSSLHLTVKFDTLRQISTKLAQYVTEGCRQHVKVVTMDLYAKNMKRFPDLLKYVDFNDLTSVAFKGARRSEKLYHVFRFQCETSARKNISDWLIAEHPDYVLANIDLQDLAVEDGLLDMFMFAKRHIATMLMIGQRDERSPLSFLDQDVINMVMKFTL